MNLYVCSSFVSLFSSSDMSPFNEQAETSLTIQTGDSAVLEVQALESQPKPAVTWEAEDGSPLYGHKYAIGPDNQLVILSVSESDQKLYRYEKDKSTVTFPRFSELLTFLGAFILSPRVLSVWMLFNQGVITTKI